MQRDQQRHTGDGRPQKGRAPIAEALSNPIHPDSTDNALVEALGRRHIDRGRPQHVKALMKRCLFSSAGRADISVPPEKANVSGSQGLIFLIVEESGKLVAAKEAYLHSATASTHIFLNLSLAV
jgi:hypothetical protein